MSAVLPIPAPDEPRFRLYSERDLAALPPPEWLLEAHLPEGGLSVLYGAPEAGKSFLALAWAKAIARGQTWLGHATRRGAVVYVAAEGMHGLPKRLAAYRDAHEVTGEDDVYFVTVPVNLLDAVETATLVREVTTQLDALLKVPMWPALWVLDTMHRNMVGGDENSARDVGLVIASADRIRRETNAAVLIVHHTGKQGDAERGSSALRAAADSMFKLVNEDGVISLTCDKQKDAPHSEPRRLRLVPVGESCVIEPDEGGYTPATTQADRQMLKALAEVQVDGSASLAEWKETAPIKGGAFYRHRKTLLERMLVRKTNRRYALTELGEALLR